MSDGGIYRSSARKLHFPPSTSLQLYNANFDGRGRYILQASLSSIKGIVGSVESLMYS